VAKLSIHYRQSPAQFREAKNLVYWGLLLLPWACATVAIVLTHKNRKTLRVVVGFALLVAWWQ
jgi:hypothetical protein